MELFYATSKQLAGARSMCIIVIYYTNQDISLLYKTISVRRRLSTSTYYRPWTHWLSTTPKYQLHMLGIVLWGVGQVDPAWPRETFEGENLHESAFCRESFHGIDVAYLRFRFHEKTFTGGSRSNCEICEVFSRKASGNIALLYLLEYDRLLFPWHQKTDMRALASK